jgi:hypothetical protein
MSAKQGISFEDIGPYLQIAGAAGGWSLCIGAGISKPIFPDWYSLTEGLVQKDVGEEEGSELSRKLLQDSTADTIIQASQDRLGLDDETFADMLAEELYGKIRAELSGSDYSDFKKALNADAPMDGAHDGSFDTLLKIAQKQSPNVSALPIARCLVDTLGTEVEPRAVLSFNAETLLYALCNAYIWKKWKKENTPEPGSYPGLEKRIDLVTHSISTRMAGRVPYVMCHGLLPVPGFESQKPFDPREKLVFSEDEYLRLANSAYSWQSSDFLALCSSTRVLFVGVSLSDSNMRRWLTWVHQNRLEELDSVDAYEGGVSTSHFWIQKNPGSDKEKRWIESTVAHLGVRLIWIDDWNQTGAAFRRLLGLN